MLRYDHLKKVVKKIAIEDIVIETDSYPQYFKKNRQRWTEPKDVKLVAQEISRIKSIEIEKVGRITSRNALNFLKL